MVKINILFISIMLTFSDISLSTTIECKFRYGTFIVVGTIYQCVPDKDPNIITQQSAQIDLINGAHQTNKGNKDIFGFYAGRRTIQHFPIGLDKYFQHLKSIQIISCQLKEIHQSDLKPFPELILIYMEGNSIEVLEEGLFSFNPNLKVIGFAQNKIIHIDSKIFDHLTQLSDFLFNGVPCISQTIYGSVDKVKEVIKLVKSQCVSSDLLDLEAKIENFEKESKSLNSEDFSVKMMNFENDLKGSKFFNFRPISYKFQNLKNLQNNESATEVNSQSSKDLEQCSSSPNQVTPSDAKVLESCPNCCPSDQITALDMKIGNLSENFNNYISESTEMKSIFTELKKSHDNLKASHDTVINSISELGINVNDIKTSKDDIKSLKEKVKETITDTSAAMSDIKTNQIELQVTLTKLKTTQNEMKISLNDLKSLVLKNDNSNEKFSALSDKLENVESHLIDFETKAAENFEKIEKELLNTRHKISLNFDDKIKGIEKRMMKKFEELLMEKLEQVFDARLRAV